MRLAAVPAWLALFLFASVPAWAQNQSLLTELNPATPTAFAPGATVVYRVTASCNNLTGGCGNLNISDTLPVQLEALSCNAPPSVSCTITGGGTGYSINKTPYNGGDTLAITLTTRVRLGEDPAAGVINTANATAGNVTNPMVSSSAPPISINAGTPNWQVRKQRIDPTGVAPAPGAPVTYRVQLCSVSGVGNVDLDNAVLVDTLPTGTTVVDAGGGTVALGPPTTVTWNLGAVDLATLYGGNAANTTQCIDRFLTIAVPPPPAANVGDMLVNTADGMITPQGQAPLGIGPAVVNDTLVGPVGNANPSKFGNDVAPSAGFTNINWRPTFNTNGSNVPLTDFSFVDVLPPNAPGTAGPFNLVSIRSGTWTAGDPLLGYQIVADLQTAPAPCSATTGTYATVAGGVGIANNANTLFSAGAAFPATDRCVRWVFRNIGGGPVNEVPRAFNIGTRPQIIQMVPPGEPAGTATNCAFVRLTAGAGPAQTEGPACDTINIEPPTPAIQINKTRVGSGQIQPTTELVFRLSFNHLGDDSTGDIVNPTVADLLPANLEFVGWEAYSYSGPAAAQPYLTVTENYGGSGRTLVRFTWNPVVPAGAVTFAGAPAVGGNPATFARTVANNAMPDMDIRVRVLPGTAAATYSNELAVFHQGSAFTCGGSGTTSVIDVDDRDADTNSTEPRCQNNLNYTVIDAAVLLGEKWILGDPLLPNVDDPTDMITPPGGLCPDYGLTYGAVADGYTRFPCVAQTDHGGNFTYRARIQNAGNLNLDDYYLYDLLPLVGDTGSGGPLSTTARESRYRPVLTGPVTVESNSAGGSTPVVEYTTTPNPCRPEVGYTTGCNATTYVLAGSVADFSLVTAFRIRDFVGGDFGTLELIEYSVPMRAPISGGPPSIVGNPMIFNPSWNSFAHRAREASAGNNGPLLQVAEPPKVGIILPERYRLGNLVWRDLDNDGNAENGEPGINGVSVSLCRDDDGSAGPSAGDSLVGSVLTSTVGGQPGKYAFDTLLGGADYYLAIADGQPALTGLLSSSNGEEPLPDADVDNNDNGVGPAGASCAGTAIRSGLIQLGLTGLTEPTTELLRVGSATDDDNDGNAVYADGLSNYSVDFGFVPLTDLGDLPDTAAGVGAGNYETLLANGGARHTIVPGLRLGACNDAEINGAPTAAAIGDDVSTSFYTDGACAVPGDDEDGIDQADLDALFVFGPAQFDFTATNLTATAATACGYLDFNADGVFSGAEIVTVSVPAATNNGAFSFNFGTVPVGANGTRYARFRISTDGTPCSTANANGDALSGEVEDYVIVIALPTDLGDLPDAYGTLIGSNGPRHPARPNLQLGACFDAEADGQPGVMAMGDDTGPGTFTQGSCAVANDDEDGVQIADLNQQIGAPATLRVDVTNNTGVAAQLCGFVDWNGNGNFADTVGGTPESTSVAVPNGTAATLLLNFGTVPQQAIIGATYARVRLSTDLGPCSPVGAASDGEVEDYLLTITATDLGDLPDPAYPTLLASNGAVHTIVPGVFLGAGVDAEIDGQPNAAANGDDAAVSDDEDGVVHPGVYGFTVGELIAGRANPVQISASVAGFVNCWYDFDGNGSLLDAGEQVFFDQPLAAGANNLSVSVPVTAATQVYLRCRFTTGAGQAVTPTGGAPNGEVEDYVLNVVTADLGDLPDAGAGVGSGNYETLLASGGAEHILRSDGPVFGESVDAEADGQPGANADGDDLSGSDDENGITVADLTFVAGSPATINFTASNPNAAAATACAYVDWNGDGDFADTVGGTPEATSLMVASGAVNAALVFNFGTTPTNAVQDTYARFRISTSACAPNGPQSNGEVEDYVATVLLLDLGDLPDTSAGSGNGDYQTLLANGGPAHVIVAGIQLGTDVDFEADGQPTVIADGDDSAGNTPDDEAAVDQAVLNALFRTGPAQVPVAAMNTGGLGDVYVCGFIDFNADGDFDDGVAGPGGYSESAGPISVADGTAGTVVMLDFGTVPADAILDTYARFRISNDKTCSPVGTAANGEVEDYALNVIPLDLGDLPENGGNWATTLANDGPRHVIFPEIFLGVAEDLEVDGVPSVDADGDDLAGLDDEDGVDITTLRFIAGRTTTVNVTATNTTGAAATLCGYVDLNANDSFEPGELVSANVPDGSNALLVPLDFNVPLSVVTGSSYARFRLSSDGSPCAPNGLALDGEVEDYVVELVELDLGDLPDSAAGTAAGDYQTRSTDNGPSHVIVNGLFLGASVDNEADGQPTTAADGDDLADSDDEDGVADDQLELLAGLNGTINVQATNQSGLGGANVCGFVDFNADGDFADAGETTGPVAVGDGSSAVSLALDFGTVPMNAATETYARFRIS
ncbi:MAG: hypothetical protein KDI56_07470, partial [Xanthomonadales bacterium]|nr:hypothetical protein [Xanthomonadales bacterium]